MFSERSVVERAIYSNKAFQDILAGLEDPATNTDRLRDLLHEMSLLIATLAGMLAARPEETVTAPEVIRILWDFSDKYHNADPLDRAAFEEQVRRGLRLR